MKGCLFVGIAAAWIGLGPLPAAIADSPSVHLEWEPPVGSTCMPQVVLEQDVERALGRRVFTQASPARLNVRATIEDLRSGVLVRIEEWSANGELLGSRELRAPAGQCATLRTGIGLVLMLVVEREAGEPNPLRLDVGLWGGLLVNVLPRAAFGVGPALALDVGAHLQLRADAAYWLPVAIETARGIQADLHTATLALRICPQLAGGDGAWRLHVCGGAQFGALIAVQTRPEARSPEVRLLAQVLGELRGAVRVGSTARFELAAGPILSLGDTKILSVRSDGSGSLLYAVPSLGMILSAAFII